MTEQPIHIGPLIKQVSEALERQANNHMRSTGVSFAQMRVLEDLSRADGGALSLKRLESSAGVAQSTMWGIVSRLEAKGLVGTSTSASDRRARVVTITSEGRRLCDDALAHVKGAERLLTADLTAQEADQLARLLVKTRDSLLRTS